MMRAKGQFLLRVALWIGLISCVLIAISFDLSHWWAVAYDSTNRHLTLARGWIAYTGVDAIARDDFLGGGLEAKAYLAQSHWNISESKSGWYLIRQRSSTLAESFGLPGVSRRSTPVRSGSSVNGRRSVWVEEQVLQCRLPVWLVLVIAAIPTVLCCYLRRKLRRRVGCCQCGYNLLGNVSGICPECGESVPEDVREWLETSGADAKAIP